MILPLLLEICCQSSSSCRRFDVCHSVCLAAFSYCDRENSVVIWTCLIKALASCSSKGAIDNIARILITGMHVRKGSRISGKFDTFHCQGTSINIGVIDYGIFFEAVPILLKGLISRPIIAEYSSSMIMQASSPTLMKKEIEQIEAILTYLRGTEEFWYFCRLILSGNSPQNILPVFASKLNT